jgi:hypothetical protein
MEAAYSVDIPVTITLTPNELNVLLTGLGELPMKYAKPVENAIQTQVFKQVKDHADKKADKADGGRGVPGEAIQGQPGSVDVGNRDTSGSDNEPVHAEASS